MRYPNDVRDIFKSAKNDTQLEIIGEGANDFLSNQHRLEGVEASLQGETRVCQKLYDLPSDPDEAVNLIEVAKHQTELNRLKLN